MASNTDYVAYEVGDVVMPADIYFHREIQHRLDLPQMSIRLEVVAVREVKFRGFERHTHPQMVTIRVLGRREVAEVEVPGDQLIHYRIPKPQ